MMLKAVEFIVKTEVCFVMVEIFSVSHPVFLIYNESFFVVEVIMESRYMQVLVRVIFGVPITVIVHGTWMSGFTGSLEGICREEI